jgi:F0F1-type ATP synthase membrane subunit b/b'
MATWREKVDELVRDLQQDRDELRVKAALGKAELKDELAELDAKLDDILDDAREKTSGWMKELKEEYQKLRDRLDRDERPTA